MKKETLSLILPIKINKREEEESQLNQTLDTKKRIKTVLLVDFTVAGDRFGLSSSTLKWISLSHSLSPIHQIPSLQNRRTPIIRIQLPTIAPATILPIPSLTLATSLPRPCQRTGAPSPWAPNPKIHLRLHLKLSQTARLVLRSTREMPPLCRLKLIPMFLRLQPMEILLPPRVSAFDFPRCEYLLSVRNYMKLIFNGCACVDVWSDTVDSVKVMLGRWGKRAVEATKKAEDLAGNMWQHCKPLVLFNNQHVFIFSSLLINLNSTLMNDELVDG